MTSGGEKLTVFNEIYTSEVLSKIAERAKSDKGLKVLERFLASDNQHLRIERVHFDKCLRFAKERNGIDTDRLGRLREPDNYAAWRSIHNELLVPYFFARGLKLKIRFIINARERGLGDFQVVCPEGVIIVEVKTPKGDDPDLQGPKDSVHAGLDENLLRPAFIDGASQLKRGNKNLIVICTQLCAWIHDSWPFEKLFYGQEVITAPFAPDLGRAVGPIETKFIPDGELHRHVPRRFTRISAIAAFSNDTFLGSPFSEDIQQVQFTVLHNYFARCPIEPSIFGRSEQFVPDRTRKAIKHIKEKNTCVLLYSRETEFANLILRLTNHMYAWFRKLRMLYYRIKMRRVAKSMNQRLREPNDNPRVSRIG